MERYEAIGGTSPLIRITEGQRSKLQSRLAASGSETRVYSAMKHSPPFIADVVKEAAADGVDELLSIALAPHFSKMSVGTYMLAVELANEGLSTKMKLGFVTSWHRQPELIEAWANRIKLAERALPGGLLPRLLCPQPSRTNPRTGRPLQDPAAGDCRA